MRVLIIPDLHHRVDWVQPFLAERQFDQVVFLGDYFDDFGDSPVEARHTAVWLREMVDDPRAVFLLGNHDLSYAFPHNARLRCPGYTREKEAAIREVLAPEQWTRFKLCHSAEGFLLSHAGVCRQVFEHPVHGLSVAAIEERCAQALEHARGGRPDPVFGVGRARLGRQPRGGITWLDWTREFEPIAGLNQVVGHTPGATVREKGLSEQGQPLSQNYCLDTNSGHAGWLENGRFHYEATGIDPGAARGGARHHLATILQSASRGVLAGLLIVWLAGLQRPSWLALILIVGCFADPLLRRLGGKRDSAKR